MVVILFPPPLEHLIFHPVQCSDKLGWNIFFGVEYFLFQGGGIKTGVENVPTNWGGTCLFSCNTLKLSVFGGGGCPENVK